MKLSQKQAALLNRVHRGRFMVEPVDPKQRCGRQQRWLDQFFQDQLIDIALPTGFWRRHEAFYVITSAGIAALTEYGERTSE